MIRPLRQRHRWMSAAMLLCSAVGLGTALAKRQAPAVMEQLPEALAPQVVPSEDPNASSDLWQGASLRTTLSADRVVLSPIEPLRVPDPLLYASPVLPSGEGLPPGSVLLGSLSDAPGQSFTLPPGHRALIIYSLGHSAVVATLSLPGDAP